MQDDNISQAAKNDPLIMAFAVELYNDHSSEQAVYIRAKVREVGRFLVWARELWPRQKFLQKPLSRNQNGTNTEKMHREFKKQSTDWRIREP